MLAQARPILTRTKLPTNTTGTDSPHVLALDGIRGLAILLVLAHHLVVINSGPTTPLYVWARAVRESLWCGVDIFFTLSGFLITGILIKSVALPGFFRNFYARRTLRIFPLYYAVLLLTFACTPLFHIHWGGQQWRLLTYSNHILLDVHQSGWNFYFGNHVNLINFWSLHVEEQFYLIWPLIVFVFPSPLRLLTLALFFSVGSLILRIWLTTHGVSHEVIYATLLTRTDSIFIGASLALLLETRFRSYALSAARPISIISFIAILTIFIARHGLLFTGNIVFPIQFTLLAIASTALIALCLDPASPVTHLFRTPLLRFFGRYSYGLYIYHSILPMFLIPALAFLLAPIAGHFMLQHILTSLSELAAAIGISVLSYRYFESPFLRLKRYFAYAQAPPPS